MPKKVTKILHAKSITEFAGHIEKQLPNGATGNWYRGISKVGHQLTPGLFRHPTLTGVEPLFRLEAMMLEDFDRHSVLHSVEMMASDVDSAFRKLFFMQHHGIPTRLLDWTSNPFIALYFALGGAQFSAVSAATGGSATGVAPVSEPTEDAAVWILNPVTWNRHALSHMSHGDGGPLKLADATSGYGPRRLYAGNDFEPTALKTVGEFAVCLLGITNSARMFAQRGVFTIFGKDLRPMEDQVVAGGFEPESLVKIVIPKAKIANMLGSVLRLGYTDSVSYPDLQGLAMEIKRTRGFKV